MLPIRKARFVALSALAAVLLAGCTSAPEEVGAEPSGEPSEAAQTMPDSRQVTVVEVIDPVTLVVTPTESDDELFGEEFTLHISDLVAPIEGECGFDESVAHAQDELNGPRILTYASDPAGGEWIDSAGDHYGSLQVAGISYAQDMILDGMGAFTEEWRSSYESNQLSAQERNLGLWAICPDFGA